MAESDEHSRSRERRRTAESTARRTPTRTPILGSDSEESDEAKDIPKEFKWLNRKAKQRDAKQLSMLNNLAGRVETVEDTVGQVQNQTVLLCDRMAALESRTSALESKDTRETRDDASMHSYSCSAAHRRELLDENDLKVEMRGFLYDTPKETISSFVKQHYSSYICPSAENGLADSPFVPGQRSTKMVFEFKTKSF